MLTGEEHCGRLTLDGHLDPTAAATKRGMAKVRRSWRWSWRPGGLEAREPPARVRVHTLPAVPELGGLGR